MQKTIDKKDLSNIIILMRDFKVVGISILTTVRKLHKWFNAGGLPVVFT